CNQILKLMGRRYLRETFENRVKAIKSAMPFACIGADVIVGFPGETEELFEDTRSFLEELDISYLHVFSYSERRNTKAVMFPGKVSPKARESRSRNLIELSEKKRSEFYRQHIGKGTEVLFESQFLQGLMTGFTPNYIKVETGFDKELINKSIKVKLTGIAASGNMDIIFANS
ncbi:MAG TPA: tRNA (N(6)-L-threonylcarbamoyladenosine(37)-C(2))-methylthiotransferase MtaB, partial [Bacteroidales bacterium]